MFNAGPDSPTSPVKDLSTHTRALKLKHQSLEERLELCLLELRKLCIREAVRIHEMLPLSHSTKALSCAWIIKTLCNFSGGLFHFFFCLFKLFSPN